MVWRLRDAIFSAITILVLGGLLFATYHYQWFDWVRILLLFISGLVCLQTIYKLTVHPVLLQKTWRYQVDQDYIQIRHGFFHTIHMIIPMSRVEYVNTGQGPILRKFALAKITVGTITTTLEIPVIPACEAKALRERIVHYTQIRPNKVMDEANG